MHSDLTALLAAFDECGVRYLVIGGHAVMSYSDPRFTRDLDLWVATDPGNADAVFRALTRFGAPLTGLAAADFQEAGIVYQGVAPVRADVLTSVTALEFESAWLRRELRRINRLTVPVIPLDDLITNKRAAGRPRDREDVRRLERARRRPPPGG